VSGARTYTGNLPQSWVRWWRQDYLSRCRSKGSILQPVAPLTAEQQRTLRYGPCWSWWRLSDAERAVWWSRDGG
jgi:hypothetical protein